MTGRLVSLLLIATLIFAPTAKAAAPPVPVIIKLLPGTNLSLITNLLGGSIIDSIPGTNTYLVKLPNLPIVTPLLKLLGLVWIEENKQLPFLPVAPIGQVTASANAAPDWYKAQPALGLLRVSSAQQYSKGNAVVVADINSMVDYSHPALQGHMTGGYDFVTGNPTGTVSLNQSTAGFLDQSSAGFLDQSTAGFLDQSTAGFLDQSSAGFLDTNSLLQQSTAGFLDGTNPAYSHGTLCAGLIAAVAPNAKIMPIRAFDNDGATDLFVLAKAIRYAANNGAQVLNMSFGTLTNSNAIKEAIDYAKSKNVVLVASAGNNNTSAPQYPAAYAGVIAVAATDLKDVKAKFSNYGSAIYVDAPGVNVISAYPGGKYYVVSGTSFSAPIAAGTAALVRSLKSTGISTSMANAAVNIDAKNIGYAGKLGYGRLDVLKTVKPY